MSWLVLRRLCSQCQRLCQQQGIPIKYCSSSSGLFEERPDAAVKKQVFLHGYESIDHLMKANENVRQIFDLDFASRKEASKSKMADVIAKYKLSEGDTGSAEVQVAALNLRVKLMSEHLQAHRKDKDCLRRLIQLVQRRRKLLLLLKEFKPNTYHYLLTELKLKPPVVTKFQLKTHKKPSSKKRKK